MPRAVTEAVGLWLALAVATCASWWLGADHGLGTGDLAVASIITLAFVKAWLVGRRYMELGTAPPLLRGLFDAWIAGVGLALLVGYVVT